MSISKKTINNLLNFFSKPKLKNTKTIPKRDIFKLRNSLQKVSPKIGPGFEEAQGGCGPVEL
jgi:hypothetical protein